MEQTVAEKLDALLKLQEIDNQIDSIIKLRGDLPEEIRDLEDEIEGLNTRKSKFDADIEKIDGEINVLKQNIKTSEGLIKKYEEQQMTVRNNREYDAITKEIELQTLEIQISEKKIKEASVRIEFVKAEIAKTENTLTERNSDLDIKKKELAVLTAESEEDEQKLLKSREKVVKSIEDRLIKYYHKLRKHLTNGLAVVIVKNDGAVPGTNIMIPPQKVAEVRMRNKIIVDENSGRILAAVEEQVVEDENAVAPGKKIVRRKITTGV